MRTTWAGLWRSENRRDGKTEHLLYRDCLPCLFRTRREAREYIEQRYGYIRGREDLKTEPHGWRVPVAVKVRVEREAA